MTNYRLPLSAFAAALLLLAWVAPASAQDVIVQGPGVKLGEATVLHPRAGVEAGVIENVFYSAADEVASPVVRLLAGFDITPSGIDRLGAEESANPKVAFKAGAALAYTEYLSSDLAVRKQRNLDADARAEVTLNPKGKVALDLGDRFLRTTRPANFEGDAGLGRNRNHFRTEGRWQPGGGTLKIGLRYENVIDVFDRADTVFADRLMQTVGTSATWKFFPFSQVYVDASLGFFGPLGDSPFKRSSNPLRLIAGIDTVITPPTWIKAYAGYANGFYADGPSYNTPVGGITFGWTYMPVGKLMLDYHYDVNDSISANFFAEHHLGASIAQQIARFNVSAGAGVRFRDYLGVPLSLSTMSTRSDFIYEATGRLEYLILDRFSTYIDAVAQSDSTDFRDNGGTDPSFFRAEIVAGFVAAF